MALHLLFVPACCLFFLGCLNLKPAVDQTRFFSLTPAPAATAGPQTSAPGQAVGLARVDLPGYLDDRRIAQRAGTLEIRYSDTLRWAERLDKNIQRVLTANLEMDNHSHTVVLNTWRRADIRAVLHVSFERFETETSGRAVLDARWRLTNAAGDATLNQGSVSLATPAPDLGIDPEGAVARLGELLEALSRALASAIRTEPVQPVR